MTPQQHAQAAARDAPTPAEIARVNAALLCAPPHCHFSGPYRGRSVGVYDSPFTPGLLLVSALHPVDPPLSEEVADLAAAREWLRRVLA
jgi:hypothetical protein